jgi:hypothetical protein
MGCNGNKWPDVAVQVLTKHWLGGKSCSEIARLIRAETGIEVTRNAVIGKRVRIGLPERGKLWGYTGARDPDTGRPIVRGYNRPKAPKASKTPKPPKPPRPQPRPAQKAPPPLPALYEPQPDSVRWRERPRWGCEWIFGEPYADALCCGRPVEPGSPWCAAHAALILNQARREAA